MKQTFNPIWCFLILLLFSSGLTAQSESMDTKSPSEKPEKPEKIRPEWASGFAIGASTGTQALFGIDAAIGIAPFVTARVGYNHRDITLDDRELSGDQLGFTDNSILYSVDAKLSTISALFDFSTGKANMRWLRLTTGLHFALDKEVTSTIGFKNNVRFNDLDVTPEELGGFTLIYENENLVMPYIGLGIGPTLPWKNVSFGVDLGGIYRGKPTYQTIGSGLLVDNDDLGDVLATNTADRVKWYPVTSIRLAVRIK